MYLNLTQEKTCQWTTEVEGILLREAASEAHLCCQQNLQGWWGQEGMGRQELPQDKALHSLGAREGFGSWKPQIMVDLRSWSVAGMP